MRLLIKGNETDARIAANAHGLMLSDCKLVGDDWGVTQATIRPLRSWVDPGPLLAAWHAEEPRQAPYPTGSLLCFWSDS
jgi:hypothetical protein